MIALLVACSPERPVHTCDEWADCGAGGACEPAEGACSFFDEDCTSGRRYSEFAPGDLADACVPLVEAPARGELCSPDGPACAELRECLGNRCVSIAQLSATTALVTARCANGVDGFGPTFLWGQSTVFSNFTPRASGLNACPVAPCPAPCGQCTTCPSYCLGDSWARLVSAGTNHLCIDNGATFCFGDNTTYQTGFDQPTIAFFWVPKHYDLIASGVGHTCGRVPAGIDVECWGDNAHGQLGMPPSPAQAAPVVVAPFPVAGGQLLESISFLSASETFTCAATRTRVACWGQTPTAAGIVEELGGSSIDALETGAAHACVIRDGRAFCWGANESGQSAPGVAATNVPPTEVLPDVELVSISAGRAHTCAVATTGAIYCWGDSSKNQLGDGVAGPGPVIVDTLPGVGPMTAGLDFTCAVQVDDHIRCWGDVFAYEGITYDDLELCVERGATPP